MAFVPDIWVDLPEMEGGPDRVSMAELSIALPAAAAVPPAAWRVGAVAALRLWFHEIPALAWAWVTGERTGRSAEGTPEVVFHRGDLATVLERISPRQVEDGAAAAAVNRRAR